MHARTLFSLQQHPKDRGTNTRPTAIKHVQRSHFICTVDKGVAHAARKFIFDLGHKSTRRLYRETFICAVDKGVAHAARKGIFDHGLKSIRWLYRA